MSKPRHHSAKRTIALLLTILLLTSLLPTVALAADYNGHWAEKAIERAVELGWFADADNTRPDAQITRAEFVTMVNRVKGFDGQADLSAFSDIEADDWYYGAFSAAVAQSYIQGNDGKLNPTANISRNEAVTILVRISELDSEADNSAFLTGVRDAEAISSWAVPYVGAAVKAGLIAGSNGNFNGASNITRGETAVLLERLHDNIRAYGFAGTYTGDAGGIVISAPGVKLENMNITGNLTVAAAVGDGEVTLSNVKIGGKLNIEGGGKNSVYLENCEIAEIAVTKEEVRVVFSDGTVVVHANVAGENAQIVIGEGAKVGNVVIDASAQGASLAVETGAEVTAVEVAATNSNVAIAAGVTVATVVITEAAAGSNVAVADGATVTNAKMDAPNAKLDLAAGATVTTVVVTPTATGSTVATQEGAKIDTIVISAAGTNVTGNAEIKTANIKAADVKMDTAPTENLFMDEGVKADVANETKEGTAATQNNEVPEVVMPDPAPPAPAPEPEPEPPAPPPPSTGGGGGGGGGYDPGPTYYTVTFNADGGTSAPANQSIVSGGIVSQPEAMTKADYIFVGWFKDAGFTTAWNFASDTVTAVTTIYAKWMETPKKYVTDNLDDVNAALVYTPTEGSETEFAELIIAEEEKWTTGPVNVTVSILKGDAANQSVTQALNTVIDFIKDYEGITGFTIHATGGTTNNSYTDTAFEDKGEARSGAVAIAVMRALGITEMYSADMNAFIAAMAGGTPKYNVFVTAHTKAPLTFAEDKFVFEFTFVNDTPQADPPDRDNIDNNAESEPEDEPEES